MQVFKLTHYRQGRTADIQIRMVLCTDNEFHDASSNFTHKTWKTQAGAERYASDRWNSNGRTYCRAELLTA